MAYQARGTWEPAKGRRLTAFVLRSRQGAALSIDEDDARGEVNDDTDNGLKAGDAFHAATAGGALALGLENRIGRIQAGYQADITFIDKDDLVYQPLNDVKRQLVYGEGGRGVRNVMVAGRFVVRDGRVLGVDTAALRAELFELMPELRRDAAAVEARARALDAIIDKVEQRCLGIPVGMRRMASEGG